MPGSWWPRSAGDAMLRPSVATRSIASSHLVKSASTVRLRRRPSPVRRSSNRLRARSGQNASTLCRALLRSPRARQRFVGWTSSSIDGLRPVQAMPGSNISTARWWSGLRRPDARPTGTGSLDSVRIAHKNITDAIAAGDSTTAREAMLQHLTEIVELTRPTLE